MNCMQRVMALFEIIRWIEDNLEINFIAHSENLGKIEESLIVKYVPLLNLNKNPVKLSELVELRRKCEAVAGTVRGRS